MHPEQENLTNHPAKREPIGEGARLLLVLAAGIIVCYGMQQASSIIVPVVTAGFLAIISYSVTDILRRFLKFPHWLAVMATVAIDFGIIFGIISLMNFLAADLIATLKGDISIRFTEKFDEIMAWLREHNLEVHARALVKSPQDIFDPAQIIKLTQTLSGQVLSFMTSSGLVLILMTFFLGEAPLFHRNLNKLGNSNEGKNQFLKAIMGIQRYLFIKTIASATTGLLAWWLCASLNIPFAFLWGVTAFVLNYIPTFGSIVAAVPPIILGFLLGEFSTGVMVAAGYLFINSMIGNGIEPLFLGRQFGISTSVVLLCVLIWGWILGPIGMLLAVPITVLIKLAFENSRDLAWMAILISDETPSERAERRLQALNKHTNQAQ
ncbi:MAG: AI-2E family transporter [Akkermansia sp.]